jgi:hypothetical protein
MGKFFAFVSLLSIFITNCSAWSLYKTCPKPETVANFSIEKVTFLNVSNPFKKKNLLSSTLVNGLKFNVVL